MRTVEPFPNYALLDEFTIIKDVSYFRLGTRCTFWDDPDHMVIKLPDEEAGYATISIYDVELPTRH